jgi:tetraprenyl-beta-curcumene synthase
MEPHTHPTGGSGTALRDATAVAAALGRYWLTILPQAHAAIEPWRRAAAAIPDSTLRRQAVAALGEERLNVEAAAVFALLAPPRQQRAVVRLCVAFQAMYDFLDTLGEQEVADPLANGLHLHEALRAVFDSRSGPDVWFVQHSHRDDGGYLASLVAASRASYAALPAADRVRDAVMRAVTRCGEAQAHTHASHEDDCARLEAWARASAPGTAYLWWEVAAGAISSVGVYALFAAAADPRTTAPEADRIDAAYFPAVCALSSLLDSLIDRDRDAGADDVSSVANYADSAAAAQRLAAIAGEAARSLHVLRRGHRHRAILDGIGAYYTSAREADSPWAAPVADAVVRQLGPTVSPIRTTMRLRRRLRA